MTDERTRRALAATGLAALLAVAAPASADAGEADVEGAGILPTGDGRYRVEVTVRHADTGWEHYADRWEVLTPDGRLLATRVLVHPHVDEQPFTRSLSGVEIPADVSRVVVRAHDKVHGYGGREVAVAVPR